MRLRTFSWITLSFVVASTACGSMDDPLPKAAAGGGGVTSSSTTSTAGVTSSGAGGSTAGGSTTSSTAASTTVGGSGGSGGSSSVIGMGGASFDAGPSGMGGASGGTMDDGGRSDSGAGGRVTDGASPPGLRVVGYLPNYAGSYSSWAKKINFAKMTHLNLAFASATATNGWSMGASDADVKAIVDAAHAAGTKVLASLGGGGGDQTVIARYKTPSNVDDLVTQLDAFLMAHNLDGADVDIEDPSNLGANYSTFVSATVAKLRPEGKLVTAAVAQYLQSSMADATLRQFDFVNVMIYSNLQQTMSDIGYYANTKKLPKDTIVLGAGFFGTDSSGNEYAYADIIKADPNAWQKDQTQVGGKTVNYTGMMSMAGLVQYSKTVGGIMFWDLSEDTSDEHSLWKVIQDNW